jgi:hypothetical protein
VPVYITECAPEHVRGVLGIWQIAVTSGILIASAANLGLKNWPDSWRLSYGKYFVFAFVPWLLCLHARVASLLAANSNEDRLKESLAKLRYEDEVESEVQKLEEVEEDRAIGNATWSEIFSTDNMRWRLMLGCSSVSSSSVESTPLCSTRPISHAFTESEAIYGTSVSTVSAPCHLHHGVYGGQVASSSWSLEDMICPRRQRHHVVADQTKTVGVMVLIFASLHWFAFSWGPVVWLCLRDVPLPPPWKATGLTTMTNRFTTIGVCSRLPLRLLFPAALAFFAVFATLGTIVVYFSRWRRPRKRVLRSTEASPQAPAQAQGLEDVKQAKARVFMCYKIRDTYL